jgi:Mg2+/Co2+ transporter CorC
MFTPHPISSVWMQRRDAKSFLEEVLSQIPDLDPKMRAELLELVDDKPGTKRAAKLAAVLAADESEAS